MSTIKNEIMNQTSDNESVLEKFINIPGLQHLAENIFMNLNYRDLEAFGSVKGNFQHFLDQLMENPLFWMKKFVRGGMSKKNETNWIEMIQMTRGTKIWKHILSYFKRYFKNEIQIDFDLPCYIKKENLIKLSEIIKKTEDREQSIACYYDKIVKILDHLAVSSEDPDEDQCTPNHWAIENSLQILSQFCNAPDEFGRTPIYVAAYNGYTEVVKVLALLTDKPNAPKNNGITPIYEAAWIGCTEIVKILVHFTDNLNVPDKIVRTPIYVAAYNGHTEIVKILAPLTHNPNAPNNCGQTPIHKAAVEGYTEIVKILAHLTDNPNAPDIDGETPIHLAAYNGYTEIVKILAPLTDNPNAPDKNGCTPMKWAKGKTEIIKILTSLTEHPDAPNNSGRLQV